MSFANNTRYLYHLFMNYYLWVRLLKFMGTNISSKFFRLLDYHTNNDCTLFHLRTLRIEIWFANTIAKFFLLASQEMSQEFTSVIQQSVGTFTWFKVVFFFLKYYNARAKLVIFYLMYVTRPGVVCLCFSRNSGNP